ncbi:MAG: DciA family protein [Alphaproteobacteria bacterium]|nr:DciA family protein [Alphaproteobacteria bacterium]
MWKPRSLADAVDKVARQSAGKDWGLYANLLGHWTEIVGADYARDTTPVKISFPYRPHEAQRKNGTLTIRLPKGLAMEFSFKSDQIRRRVNAFFGYEAFDRVALDPASIPSPPAKHEKKADPAAVEAIKKETEAVDNEDLRKALEAFGETLLTKT